MRNFFLSALAFIAITHHAASQTTIYSLAIDSLGGTQQINLSSLQGKLILIVNTASEDSAATQCNELLGLSRLYPDQLIIILVPTNDFGTESGNLSALSGFYSQFHSANIKVAAVSATSRANMTPLFLWLTKKSMNKLMDSNITTAFKKYLISSSGHIIGVFSKKINPLNKILINAINAVLHTN